MKNSSNPVVRLLMLFLLFFTQAFWASERPVRPPIFSEEEVKRWLVFKDDLETNSVAWSWSDFLNNHPPPWTLEELKDYETVGPTFDNSNKEQKIRSLLDRRTHYTPEQVQEWLTFKGTLDSKTNRAAMWSWEVFSKQYEHAAPWFPAELREYESGGLSLAYKNSLLSLSDLCSRLALKDRLKTDARDDWSTNVFFAKYGAVPPWSDAEWREFEKFGPQLKRTGLRLARPTLP